MVDGVSAVEKAHDLRITFKVHEVSAVIGAARTERQLHRLQYGHFLRSQLQNQLQQARKPCIDILIAQNIAMFDALLGRADQTGFTQNPKVI